MTSEGGGGEGEIPAFSTMPSSFSPFPSFFIASTNSKTERGEERSSGRRAARARAEGGGGGKEGEVEVEVEGFEVDEIRCRRLLISATAASHASLFLQAKITSME